MRASHLFSIEDGCGEKANAGVKGFANLPGSAGIGLCAGQQRQLDADAQGEHSEHADGGLDSWHVEASEVGQQAEQSDSSADTGIDEISSAQIEIAVRIRLLTLFILRKDAHPVKRGNSYGQH
jgi:hypothetical protein